MNRLVAAFALSEAVLLSLLAWLWIQNRSLREELAARPKPGISQPGATPAETAQAAAATSRAVDLEKQLAVREEQARADRGKLERDIEVLKAKLAAAEKAGATPKEDGGIKSLEDILEKHKKALIYGADIPEGVVKDLGLEPTQVVALKMAIEDELRRLDESFSRFYTDNIPGATAETAAKPAKELIMAMMEPIRNDMIAFSKQPLTEQLKIHTTSSLEEALGPDKFLAKLAREVHGVRLKTYKELERTLTPEQIAKLRSEYLREGLLAYDEQFKLEFGAAPKEMK